MTNIDEKLPDLPEKILEAFRVFGLPVTSSWEQIRETYRRLIQVWHPDRMHDNQKLRDFAEARLKEINLAYESLRSYFQRKSHAFDEPPSENPDAAKESLLEQLERLIEQQDTVGAKELADQLFALLLSESPTDHCVRLRTFAAIVEAYRLSNELERAYTAMTIGLVNAEKFENEPPHSAEVKCQFSRLYRATGLLYKRTADWVMAESYLHRAISIDLEVNPPGSSRTALDLYELAEITYELGRKVRAHDFALQSFKLFESLGQASSLDAYCSLLRACGYRIEEVSDTLSKYSVNECRQYSTVIRRWFDSALDLLRTSEKLLEPLYDTLQEPLCIVMAVRHIQLAELLGSLHDLYCGENEPGAIASYASAYQFYERVFGKGHPGIAELRTKAKIETASASSVY